MTAGLQRPSLTVRQTAISNEGEKNKAVGGREMRRDKDMKEHALSTSKPIAA